ncbi:hypothetical protein BBK82_27780 [Lentzea guizhouensis]|uniref:Uncharacterized protein n=2 Tax=Lentzea guizhouensis TaxID=1586287 RepID=A0A1B2HNJ8_9PSEU|nr:hypothetical protein BBK82_27780 [Lentzea guizhouensis]
MVIVAGAVALGAVGIAVPALALSGVGDTPDHAPTSSAPPAPTSSSAEHPSTTAPPSSLRPRRSTADHGAGEHASPPADVVDPADAAAHQAAAAGQHHPAAADQHPAHAAADHLDAARDDAAGVVGTGAVRSHR